MGEALNRTGLEMGSFILAPPSALFPWSSPDAELEPALLRAQQAAQWVGGGTCILVIGDSGAPRDAQIETVRHNLGRAAELAGGLGLRLAVEPVSRERVAGILVERADEAAALVRDIGHPSLGLLLDTCHMSHTGEDPARLLLAQSGIVAAVQIADMPGRVEPGAGQLDLAAVAAALRAIDFAGLVEAEFWPSRPGAEGEVGALSAFMDLFGEASHPR
jgi:hydroxypyruvate isomerase